MAVAASADRTALGVALITASVTAMAFADALVKMLSADVTLWQLFFTRSLFGLPIVWALARWRRRPIAPKAVKWVLARSLSLVICWVLYYASLSVLDLSVAAVAIYTAPLMIALMSAAVTGDAVTRRQWIGVLLGFVGVVVILRPGTDAFSYFALLPIAGAVFFALAMVLTRSHCRDEGIHALGFVQHGAFFIAGLIGVGAVSALDLSPESAAAFPFLLSDWAGMGAREWGLVALLGALSAGYFIGVARAYQIAPPSIVATFDYTYLISAALWGFVFFAETPDFWVIGGIVLITAAGVLVASPARRGAAGR